MCHCTVPLGRQRLLIPLLSYDFAALRPLQIFPHFSPPNIYSSSTVTHPYFSPPLSCLIARFAYLGFFFSLPMSSQPFKLFPENAGTRRKKEKSVLACALQPVTLHNVHWHTGVDCILFSIQTRCEALMYGSVVFFSSSSSQGKTDLCQKCSPSAILAQRCKNTFQAHSSLPSFCSQWLGRYCVI